jgi:hypothetical protein
MDCHIEVLYGMYGQEVVDYIMEIDSVWMQSVDLQTLVTNIEAYYCFV